MITVKQSIDVDLGLPLAGPHMVLIRGVQGTGKSTLAKKLLAMYDDQFVKAFHYEADMYFVDEEGNYKWDVNGVAEAHNWCQRMARLGVLTGNIVIVSNTFTLNREMVPYIDMAKKAKAHTTIIECKQVFGNVHDVSDAVVKRYQNRWQEVSL